MWSRPCHFRGRGLKGWRQLGAPSHPWDSPVSPPEPRERPQGPAIPGALCTPLFIDFKNLYSSFFCAAVSVSPPSSTPTPRQTQTPPQLWHFGVALCFSLQDTPNQSPGPGRSDRSGRLGCALAPRHAELAPIALPAPPRVAAQPQLN